MDTVKRYKLYTDLESEGCSCCVDENPSGSYVAYEDYESLQHENEALREQLQHLGVTYLTI